MHQHRIMAVVTFTIVFFLSLWAIDLSVTAMLNPGMVLTNGMVARAPVQVYHFGLYGAILSFFVLICLAVDVSKKNLMIDPLHGMVNTKYGKPGQVKPK